MKKFIIEKIESLPPLPKSVIDLEEYRKKSDKEPLELAQIIEKDPLIVTTLLRVANSSMFGFRSEVDTPSRAINLLGVNFTISIALGSVVQDLIDANLNAYGVSTDDFMFTSNLASVLVNNWVGKISYELKEELLLPAFLQETGKFIISEIVNDSNKVEEFKNDLQTKSIFDVEKEYTSFSCSKITANIFKHWKLSHSLVFTIGFVGDQENCPAEYKEKTQILEIIKILCNITDPLGDKVIAEALEKAALYNLDVDDLLSAIDTVKENIKRGEEE